MRSRPNPLRRPFRLLAGLLILSAASCAQQDLYDPPGAPFFRVGRVALPSQNEDVSTLDRTAFVAGGQAGLHAVDFSDPAAPELLQTTNTLKYSESVAAVRTLVDGSLQDIALVVEGTEGITSYDVTDPAAMTSFNTSTTAVFGNRVYVEQPDDPQAPYIVYLAESWKGVRVFESLPEQPGILAYNGVFVGTNGYAEGIVVRDGWGYAADDQMGVAVLDLRILDLNAVNLASWCDSPGEALDIDLVGDYVYVADGDAGLAVFRVHEGDTPVHTAQLALEGKCRAIAVRDGLAVLAAQGSGVHFVDVSDPAHPVFLGRVLTEYAMDLCFSHEGLLLVVDRDEGLIILQGDRTFADTTAPAPVVGLEAEPFGAGAVRLSWIATGGDRYEGLADAVEVRRADAAIADEAAWDAAAVVPGTPAPAAPGQAQEFVVQGLEGGAEQHFAVRLRDAAGNLGGLPGDAVAAPGEGIVLLDGGVDVAGGTTDQTFTFAVTYVFGAAPTVHDVLIDGEAFAMTAVGPAGTGTRYQHSAVLGAGDHAFSFRFAVDDPEVPAAETGETFGPVVGRLAFSMGSPEGELGRDGDEWRHTVVLSDSLTGGLYEVTQQQWADLGLGAPSHFTGADLPVESITWHDAVAFCNALSAADGLDPAYAVDGEAVTWDRGADGWRLPTEAEWEWLSRAGSTTSLPGGDLTALVCNDDPVLGPMAWYCGSFAEGETPGTRAAGQKQAGPRGAYDLAGNVAEWCWDLYGDYRLLDADGDGVVRDPAGAAAGAERVVRGGSWYGGAEDCRSAARARRYPDSADDTVGLRVVRTIFAD